MIIKRKNNKKTNSFDLIKFTPIEKQIDQEFTKQTNSPKRNLYFPQEKKIKNDLQLPKIHSYHMHSVSFQGKKYKNEVNGGHSMNKIDSRLLMMGYHYKKNTTSSRQSKQVLLMLDARQRQKQKQRQRNDFRQQTAQFLNKKAIISNNNCHDSQIFYRSILYGLKIYHISILNKKLNVYIQEGNNSRMIKQILRKRPKLKLVQDKKQAHIVWTQFCDYQSSNLPTKIRQVKTQSQKIQTDQEIVSSDEQILESSNSVSLSSNNYQKIKDKHHSLVKSLAFSKFYPQASLQYSKSRKQKTQIIIEQLHYHNHLSNHHQISDKKSLFMNLAKYCKEQKQDLFNIVPYTCELNPSSFVKNCNILPNQIDENNLWFIKPGEDTNRGNGISIAIGRQNIEKEVINLFKQGKTAIVQKYIQPLLYKNRKFDIRCYALVVSFRGNLKAYWYKEGYIRTCSKQFNRDPKDEYAHLTNDAIQKKSSTYGKYQHSNKLSFTDIQNYLRNKDISFKQIKQNMKMFAYYSIKSAQNKLKNKQNEFAFQIFGYDFLIDKKGKVWLIQVNTNPCLEFSGSLTSRIIWHMVDNSFKICLDPFWHFRSLQNIKIQPNRIFEDNRYECII